MLQELNIGQTVDDGQGDYLKKGGSKIKSNFQELYYDLGNGVIPHPAGAWKTVKSNTLDAAFGKAYVIDTTSAKTVVQLPKGNSSNYNNVIRLRDVYASWRTNNVTIVPAIGDTIKGRSDPITISTNYSDIELVYCFPGRWEYVANKQIDRIASSDLTTVSRKEFVATEGQTDFINIFGQDEFNKNNTEVFHRGNLLYYGDELNDNSDFGSPGPNNTLVPLDGKSIRLKYPCEEGDTIIVITYMDGIAQWRSTYNRLELKVLDENITNEKTEIGSKLVADLSTLRTLNISSFGYDLSAGLINPNTFEVYINGIFQTEAGTGGAPVAICDGATADNENDCIASGGVWRGSNLDYTYDQNEIGNIDRINFGVPFEHGDIITIKWFNNNIGTTLSMDDITDQTDSLYMQVTNNLLISGGVRVTDYTNPTWPNVEAVEPYTLSLNNAGAMFDIVYPVGTIYENFINPNNPVTYNGGFGTWKLWGTKQVLIGWTDDENDGQFNQNNNDIDAFGNASKKAGGTGGSRTTTLTKAELPANKTDNKVLISDQNGDVIIGGCQFDPDEQGPALQKFREDYASLDSTNIPPKSFNNLPPYLTVYRWMRIA